MSKTLTVILGAGASHGINKNPQSSDNNEYRPPVAQEIFKDSSQFRGILHKYKSAEVLSSDIDIKLKQQIGLEQILKSYKDKSKDKNYLHVSRQFLQIPLYLQDLFGTVTQLFTHRPTEYNKLVIESIAKLDRVLFLSLNYDNLLELPLSTISHLDFSKKSDYIQPKWVLVKIHGSINWYKKFIDIEHQSPSDDAYWELLNNVTLPLPLEDEIQMANMPVYNTKYVDHIPVYPVITVPVEGKYDLNCPPVHIEEVKKFLSECKNYLIVGTSGKDQDLLEILNENAKGGRTLFVGRTEKNTEQSRNNFLSHVPQLGINESSFANEDGFSGFVGSGGLDNFLDSLN